MFCFSVKFNGEFFLLIPVSHRSLAAIINYIHTYTIQVESGTHLQMYASFMLSVMRSKSELTRLISINKNEYGALSIVLTASTKRVRL